MRGLLIAAVALIAATGAACTKRAPGTCGEDIDCAPGHDCKAGVCVRRERLRFDDKPARPEPVPSVGDVVAPPEPAEPSTIPDAAAERPAQRRMNPRPASPSAPPPAIPSSPAPPGREPMWKQRRKNS